MQNRFIDSLSELPKPLATALIPLLNEEFCGHIDASQLAELVNISGMPEDKLLLSILPIAAALAKPSISEFYVGAIAKGESGDIYMGANFELSSEALFHTVHAEQSAISHAWLNGEQKIVDIIVNFSPCGHCRQFMNELVNGININIHLPGQQPQLLAHYLPYAFGPADLQVTKPLLSKSNIEFSLNSDDPMIIEAVDQAGLSYAPYTSNLASVVLETKDGHTYCGRYAENAAFNPSMMPMQMALSNLIRHNRDYSDINRAVLIESSAGKISLANATMDTLQAVSAVELEHIFVDPS
ncbi:cytidine deaminase [Shewanella donghaensis]|uniref:cytidine deaminase n=1 Tax=Shewanella donghaensis TaxID=238836 RepID=UPI0011827EC0|nr:cytidine deaminase [Shewanella donghaensis]